MQNRELNKTQPGPPRASVKWWSLPYILITEIRLRYQVPWRTWSNTWEFGREKCAAWLKATERLLKGDGSPVGTFENGENSDAAGVEGLRRLNLTQGTKGRPGQSQGRLSRAHTEHTDGGSDMWRLLGPQESQWGGGQWGLHSALIMNH